VETQKQDQNNRPNSTVIITLILLYFGACGGLWHIGFWSTFDINFLQYIGISDIIKDFAFPFITSAGVLLFTFLFVTFANYHDRFKDPESFLYGKGRNSKTGIFLNKSVIMFITIYTIGILAFAIWGNNNKWTFIPFLISTPLAIFLTNHNFLSKTIVNPDIRVSVINFIIILPIISFCFSKKESLEIYQNLSYKKISAIELINVDSRSETESLVGLKFLGSTKDKVFLTNRDNSKTTILRLDNINYITYEKFQRKKTKDKKKAAANN
jgi:hypothetical protein